MTADNCVRPGTNQANSSPPDSVGNHDGPLKGNHINPLDAVIPVSLARRIYRSLPQRLRDIVTPVAYYFYDLLNILRPQVWSMTGEMKGCQESISVCLYSTTAQYRDYICRLFFGQAWRARCLGRTWLWNMQKAPKAASDASLVFSDLDARYLKVLPTECGILIPSWVYGESKLPRGRKEKRSLSAQNTLRKIRQHSLEFEFTHDQRHFDDFYDNMYVPYIELRYGDSAYVTPKKKVQESFDKGELLVIKKKGESIAGELITYEDSCAGLTWLGVRDGNWEYVRDGALAACYEFSFRRAEEKGCHKMNLGKTRPFLRDGLLQFKRTWSQRLLGAVSHKFLLRVVSDSPATRSFLENNPFIFERFGDLKGAVFVNGEMPLTIQKLREIRKEHFYAGMSELIVFQLSPCKTAEENGFAPNTFTEFSVHDAADPSDTIRLKQLNRAEWTDLIKGLGFAGIDHAIAIYPTNENGEALPRAQDE
jgi:hypothetical protein